MKILMVIGFLMAIAGSAMLSRGLADKPAAQSAVTKNSSVMDLIMPKTDGLASSAQEIKQAVASKTIVLESSNTLVLRGGVSADSVAALQVQLMDMSAKLAASDVIYLVLDTPGGSVFSGMELIDHLRSVPQKVATVTLFAASMGFQIVQNMDTRYIALSGTLMSHRAKGGVEGQFDGELETRYKMIKRVIDYLDAVASKRMGVSQEEYRKMIKDEYWVHGFDASQDKAADEVVSLNCGSTMTGEDIKKIDTFFGQVTVTFSKCPLVRGPLKVDFGGLFGTEEQKSETRRAVEILLNDKAKYVSEFIVTDKHFKYFSK